ncbi:MAG: hypothetical protein QOK33_2218 [Mycobacterium sp.]|nr:hypothetical protein [Mycobacterium sp.]
MAKRTEPVRGSKERRRAPEGNAARRSGDAPPRGRKTSREQRPTRSAPRTNPFPRPTGAPARPKNAAQAKARSKARKAKAPKVIRLPLRERLLIKLSSIDLNPRNYVTRVPFVVLVIGALGLGLGVTLWLSTDAAERSYQLSHAREVNQALMQQKDALERDVLEAQAAPALAESARNLGMIPSKDTAHLVQDPSGAWVVVGSPKPAEGVPPPPLNTPLPDPTPPGPPPPPAPRVIEPREVTVHLPPAPVVAPNPGAALPTAPVDTTPGAPAVPALPTAGAEVPVVAAPAAPPIDTAPTLPGPPAAADPLAPIAVPVPGTPA